MAAAATAAAPPPNSSGGESKTKHVPIPSERARTGYADIDDQDAATLMAIERDAWRPSHDSSSNSSSSLTAQTSDSKSQFGLDVSLQASRSHFAITVHPRHALSAPTAEVAWKYESYAKQLLDALSQLGFVDASALARYRVRVVVESATADHSPLSVASAVAAELIAPQQPKDDVVLVYGWDAQRGILQPWAAHPIWRLQRSCVINGLIPGADTIVKPLLLSAASFGVDLEHIARLRKALHRHSTRLVRVPYQPLSFRDLVLGGSAATR